MSSFIPPGAAPTLLALVPSIVSWIFHKNPKEAANILSALGPRRRAARETTAALSQLLDLPSLNQVTSSQIRQVLSDFPTETWHRVLFIIASNPEAPLVTRACYEGIVSIKHLLEEQKNKPLEEDLLEEVVILVERLPVASFKALAEICGLVRDSSTNMAKTTRILGPKILLPEGHESVEFSRRLSLAMSKRDSKYSSVSSNYRKPIITDEEIGEAADVFYFLVAHSAQVFFRGPTNFKEPVPAFGFRERLFTPKDRKVIQMEDRVKQLGAFYVQADEKFAVVSEKLLDSYDFADVAKALWKQYGYIPEHWLQELSIYRSENPESTGKLEWLENNLVEELTFSTQIVPRPKGYGHVEGRVPELHSVVEEFMKREHAYFLKLKKFNDCFLPELRDVGMGGKGEKWKKKLGLSEKDIGLIFGKHLGSVLNAVEGFVVALEVLRLVRKDPVADRCGKPKTRAGVLAEVFISQGAKLLESYSDYTALHPRCIQILEEATEKLQKSKAKPDPKAKNFLEMFDEVTKKEEVLARESILSILVTPCHRFTQYILLFERMLKIVAKQELTDDVEKIKEAVQVCHSLAGGLNGAIKTRLRMEKLMGIEVEQVKP